MYFSRYYPQSQFSAQQLNFMIPQVDFSTHFTPLAKPFQLFYGLKKEITAFDLLSCDLANPTNLNDPSPSRSLLTSPFSQMGLSFNTSARSWRQIELNVIHPTLTMQTSDICVARSLN